MTSVAFSCTDYVMCTCLITAIGTSVQKKKH